MKTLYLDIFSGISGDMFIGAMIDLGVDSRKLETELAKLGLGDEYHIHVRRASKQSIEGTKFDVHLSDGDGHGHHHHDEHEHEHHHEHGHEHGHAHETEHAHTHTHKLASGEVIKHSHPHHHEDEEDDHHHHDHDEHHDHTHDHDHGRTFQEIKKLVTASGLSAWVKEKAIAVFHRIAVAEGKIHGMPPEQVHFHEVGAVDSIVDIVGACIALELLGKPRVLAATVVEGSGFINCAHGRFPIPAPATLSILGARGAGVSQCDEPHELVTPTGAALLAEFVDHFGPMTGLVAGKIGFGLGTRENKTRPNVLRAILGESSDKNIAAHDWETDNVAVLEANIDDLSAEVLGHFVDAALAAGALDVFHTPIQMKKNRPGILLTVLCVETEADKFSEMILRQTSSFGVRRSICERRKLKREFKTVKTEFGEATIKLGKLDGKTIQAAPEFESCKKLAEKANVPVKLVYESVIRQTR